MEDKLDELFNEIQGLKASMNTALKKQKKQQQQQSAVDKVKSAKVEKKEKRKMKKVVSADKVAKELISSDGKIIFYRLPKKEFVDMDGSRVTLYKTYSLKKPAKAPSYSLKAIDYEKRIIKNKDGTSTEADRFLSRIVSPKLLDILEQQFNLKPVTVNEPVPVVAAPVTEPEAVEAQQQ